MFRPVHQHDCSGCQFLGSIHSKDVYQCDHIDLIIRHGSSPEENKSLPICIVRDRRPEGEWLSALELYDARYPLARRYARVI